MADNDRWRNDPERMRRRDEGRNEAGSYPYSRERGGFSGNGRRPEDERGDGSIARRGFGNDRSGFERGGSYAAGRGRSGHEPDDFRTGPERDFGDSAGYGTGGSTRDWREVMGDDERRHGGESYGTGYDRGRERGYAGGLSAGVPSRGYEERGDDRFGRGSRDQDERGVFERIGDEIRSVFGDDESGGSHRGRGPKGYQRSDQRILEDVHDRLTDDPHVDASEIEVRVENREVMLSGTVASRFEKRHAEDIAESVSGVAHVQNNIRVRQGAGA